MSTAEFSERFGLSHAVVQGPMGGVSGPELVAAVANAGGLGILPIWTDPIELAAERITATQALTDRPFAVNLRADLVQLDLIAAALDRGIRDFHLFWGNPVASMAPLVAADARVLATVWDRDSARNALDAGAVALIAQGVEAGGHVYSSLPLSELLPTVLEIDSGIPVIAAGGCAVPEDARALVASGASGVLMGSRFVATLESDAHDDYKKAVIEAGADSTARSLCFDLLWPDAPHRTLINDTYQMWEAAGFQAMGSRPGEEDMVIRLADGTPLPRYHALPPGRGMTGDIRAGAMYAGTGVTAIHDCPSASDVITRFGQALVT